MARSKKGRKKYTKRKKINTDVAVVAMILVSILLAIIIFMKTGFMGEKLSPALGGIMGPIKYVLPIGIFAIAIYIACNDEKQYLSTKLLQYVMLLVCISIMLSVFQISAGTINISKDVNQIVQDAYKIGKIDIGGGVIGTVLAAPLVNMIGSFGTIILTLGLSIVLIIFIFSIRPVDIISNFVDSLEERREERRESREEERKRARVAAIEQDKPRKETARERRLREKEEEKQKAMEIDENQITINLNGLIDGNKKAKIYNQEQENKMPMTATNNSSENSLFKEKVAEKTVETKQELNLEHTMIVEEDNYEFPPLNLLTSGVAKEFKGGKRALTDTATKLQKTLYSFGVSAKVENVSVGPAITRYELKPAEGVRVSKIANLADDIALNLAAESIRIEAPIPGKQAVGIEVPNKENEIVHFRDIIETTEFTKHKSKLAFAIGKDVAGKEVISDISQMPHVMIAGATGSGKSVCINTLISSIIYKAKPSEVKLVMIDPKIVELSVYNGIPHLLIPVVTDPKKAAGALAWAVQEMENRYAAFAAKGVRDLKGYNDAVRKSDNIGTLPHIVVIIDELADLMMVAKNDVEDAICRLAQKARAAGMHLVIATQRPSVDVITGLIKANIPSRIAFAVSSQVDSRTILDMVGAEKLLGKGDMLFYPAGASKPTRVQGAFISDREVEKIVDFVKSTSHATYSEDILESIENAGKSDKEMEMESEEDDQTDPFLMDAIDTVVETGQASTSFIQRRFKVGYARAGRIIDQMEERGIISGFKGSKPREVLVSKERWAELKMGAAQTAMSPEAQNIETPKESIYSSNEIINENTTNGDNENYYSERINIQTNEENTYDINKANKPSSDDVAKAMDTIHKLNELNANQEDY